MISHHAMYTILIVDDNPNNLFTPRKVWGPWSQCNAHQSLRSTKALKEDRQKCLQAGANDYLSKPVDYDSLLRLVSTWIKKK